MKDVFLKMLRGYHQFREKYVLNDDQMRFLAHHGQNPEIMVVACCDSRVDPALILQCDPGDLFVVRNVANIVPPYEKDNLHHGTSAALEFGISFLHVKHLILLGHSQCGGIAALLANEEFENDFITNWVAQIRKNKKLVEDPDEQAKEALKQSHQHCLTFPWIKEKVSNNQLEIHLWFFDIKTGKIFAFSESENAYLPLSTEIQ